VGLPLFEVWQTLASPASDEEDSFTVLRNSEFGCVNPEPVRGVPEVIHLFEDDIGYGDFLTNGVSFGFPF